MTGPVNLTNCDREPIHTPGSVQPHGCIIVCDTQLRTVLRHSSNATEMLRLSRPLANGDLLSTVFAADEIHDFANALARSTEPSRPSALVDFELSCGLRVDVSAHTYKGNAILEFEPSGERRVSTVEITRTLIVRLRRALNIDDVMSGTARMLRSVLAYDRVMIYKFAHDGSGRVISEAKRDDLESFLGQHFPASDIPRQARELYLRNTIRIIGDANCDRVPIEPVLDASGQPLDLSYAQLRSVSPIHCEYLRNMGVAASMSVSIIVGGQLWGLIACHHYSPKVLALPFRAAVEMFGEFFSMHLEAVVQKAKLDSAIRARQLLDQMMSEMTSQYDADKFLRARLEDLQEIVPCDGVGLWLGGVYTQCGSGPPPSAVAPLARFLNEAAGGKVWATHELARHSAPAEAYIGAASGLLAVPVSQVPRDYLMFFRKEVLQTVEWAGNPQKTYGSGEYGDRLTPRKSFAIWKEAVIAQSLPWTDADREIAESVRVALIEVLMRQSEVLAAERRQAELRQNLLNEELNHRLKNVLALIKSVVSQPVEDGRTIEDYALSLKRRILALAFAHDQVIRDGGGSLRQLLEAELSPYRTEDTKIIVEGRDLALDARSFSVLALVLHELATNAAKYGALSRPGGQLNVRWTDTVDGACELRWAEAGGPMVRPPSRRGFGTTLVDRSIPFDLGGESETHFEPSGFSARLLIPRRFITAAAPLMLRPTQQPVAQGMSEQLRGKSVLLVEDQLVIALEAEACLTDFGAHVQTAATAAEALRLLDQITPDVAILDVNLGTGTSFAVADELIKRGIPFVFATGYGAGGAIPANYAKWPIVTKPYQPEALIAAISTAANL